MARGRAVSKHFHNPIVPVTYRPTPLRPMKIFILRDQSPGFRDLRFTYSRAREERFLARSSAYRGLTRHLEFRGS